MTKHCSNCIFHIDDEFKTDYNDRCKVCQDKSLYEPKNMVYEVLHEQECDTCQVDWVGSAV